MHKTMRMTSSATLDDVGDLHLLMCSLDGWCGARCIIISVNVVGSDPEGSKHIFMWGRLQRPLMMWLLPKRSRIQTMTENWMRQGRVQKTRAEEIRCRLVRSSTKTEALRLMNQ